ncbi:guanylate kinase [Ureaplasma ceti]|uniref:Guanylate kinase n=1 Tax=Ureaplasma ceti TaxID=3119530 RepID=A0ABP9U580_9BACT
MKNGKIVIISGPSGVGKKTILDQVMADKSLNLSYSISMTTRNMRPGEVNGVDYYFVNEQEFDQAIQNNELIEWAVFCNNKYGTPKKVLQEQISQGKNVVLEIEVVGALNILKMFKPEELLSIFIVPPSIEELKQRLLKRGSETEDVINTRVKRACEELEVQKHYQNIVVNDEVDRVVAEIKEIIRNNTHSL